MHQQVLLGVQEMRADTEAHSAWLRISSKGLALQQSFLLFPSSHPQIIIFAKGNPLLTFGQMPYRYTVPTVCSLVRLLIGRISEVPP